MDNIKELYDAYEEDIMALDEKASNNKLKSLPKNEFDLNFKITLLFLLNDINLSLNTIAHEIQKRGHSGKN